MKPIQKTLIMLFAMLLFVSDMGLSTHAASGNADAIIELTSSEGESFEVALPQQTNLPYLRNGMGLGYGFSDGLCYFYNVGEKYGYINRQGQVVYPAELDAAGDFNNGFAYVKKEGVWGFLDTSFRFFPAPGRENWDVFPAYINYQQSAADEQVLEAQYITFQDKDSKLWGVADRRFNTIIPAAWEDMIYNLDNLTPVMKNGKYGYIDKGGTLVIDTVWDFAWPFSEGLAVVKKDGLYGYINEQGDVVIEPQFIEAEPFCFGVAPVLLHREGEEDRWVQVDASGSVNYRPQYQGYEWLTDTLLSVKKNDLYGLMDTQGNLLQKPQWNVIRPFSKGIAMVEGEGGYGFINDRGDVISKPQWDSDYYAYYNDSDTSGEPIVSEELTYEYDDVIRVCKNEESGNVHKCGFMDTDGHVIIPPQELLADNFSEGFAAVYHEGKHGYIDKTGKVVIPLQWDKAYAFHNGVALVMQYRPPREGEEPLFANKNVVEEWGLIGKNGQVLIEPKWGQVPLFGEGVIIADEDGLWNVYDMQGNMLSK